MSRTACSVVSFCIDWLFWCIIFSNIHIVIFVDFYAISGRCGCTFIQVNVLKNVINNFIVEIITFNNIIIVVDVLNINVYLI